MRKLCTLAVSLVFSGVCVAADEPAAVAKAAPKATYAFGSERMHKDSKVFWDGFLSGLRGFEHFYNPVGNPIYFETPFNNTGVRFLYLHHTFAEESQLQGGDLNVYALQARLAITERLGFIATKDGYSDLNADALPKENGWNNIAAGLKYAFYVDRETDFVATAGFRYEMENGDKEVLQGGVQELSPFISVAKGWGQFHFIGNMSYRVPVSSGDDGNTILQWSTHFDYEVAPESLPGFAPIVELHGLHYLDNGTRTGLKVGGLDYTNLGSTDVSGSTVVWAGIGARWKLSPHASVGAVYEHALTNQNADIFADRVTVDVELTW